MTRRDLFAELMEGFDALEESRKEKLPFRTTEMEREHPTKNRQEPPPSGSSSNSADS